MKEQLTEKVNYTYAFFPTVYIRQEVYVQPTTCIIDTMEDSRVLCSGAGSTTLGGGGGGEGGGGVCLEIIIMPAA